jgi:hypothetical protein
MTELEKKLMRKIQRQRVAMNELRDRCALTVALQREKVLKAEERAQKLSWERQKLYNEKVVFTEEIDNAIKALEAVKVQSVNATTK